ncbi:PAS domain-containing sensor histidine kinase [Constantimarinum furrinae]|nr:PAS domain S-box protein [Constantimarinum furrinae]
MNHTKVGGQYPFLKKGGEMGELIRAKNWANTLVGPIDDWPQSLKTALSILLHSKFPKFLFWGPDLICFYNDAFRPSLGKDGKHPAMLGEKGEDYWGEIWHIIKPLIDQVLTDGEATWSEDQLIPIYRNGAIENVYWTFSYSPISDETNTVAGVWVTCIETTQNILSKQKLEDSKDQLHFAVEAAKLGTWDYQPQTNVFRANKRLQQWFNLPGPDVDPNIAYQMVDEPDRDRVRKAIEWSMQYESGGEYDITYKIIRLDSDEKRTIRAIGRSWFNENKEVYRFNGILQDVTDQVLAEKENKLLSTIVAQSNEFIGMASPDNYVKYLNPAAMKMLGWDDYKNRKIEECVYPEDLPKAKKLIKKLLKQDYFSQEMRFLNEKTGEPFWLQWNGISIRDEKTNKISGLATTSPNIEEHKHAEAQLREAFSKVEESEKRFRKVADHAPVLIMMTDDEGKIRFVNKLWIDFIGTSLKQYLGSDTLKNMHPEDEDAYNFICTPAFARKEEYRVEYRVRRFDGNYRWISEIGVPRFTEDGHFEGYINAAMDIHDIKMQEHQKDLFIGMASHELKTPVTSIKGYTQVLKARYEESEDELLKNSLEIIDKQIRVLTSLISDLLDLSKMKTGGLELNMEIFDLNELIKNIVQEITLINPEFEIKFSEGKGKNVFADRERIGQVLINLLNNAVKYSPRSRRIEIESAFTAKKVKVNVRDYGIGINKENQKKIFNRFFREEGKDETTFPGFGIGLYITSDIIKKHNGTIGVNSTKGEGSDFYFTLPLQQPKT